MMLSCKDATERLSQAMDHPLSMGEKISLRLHLWLCRGCRATEDHFQFLHTATAHWRQSTTDASSANTPRANDS